MVYQQPKLLISFDFSSLRTLARFILFRIWFKEIVGDLKLHIYMFAFRLILVFCPLRDFRLKFLHYEIFKVRGADFGRRKPQLLMGACFNILLSLPPLVNQFFCSFCVFLKAFGDFTDMSKYLAFSKPPHHDIRGTLPAKPQLLWIISLRKSYPQIQWVSALAHRCCSQITSDRGSSQRTKIPGQALPGCKVNLKMMLYQISSL